MTVGGDKLTYDGDPSSLAFLILNTKIILNSIISDSHIGARWMTADITSHYLQSPMKTFQYMRIALKYFTKETRDEYIIDAIANSGLVYFEIRKGVYGLKEAGTLAFINYIVNNLAPFGHHPVQHTPGLWEHKTR